MRWTKKRIAKHCAEEKVVTREGEEKKGGLVRSAERKVLISGRWWVSLANKAVTNELSESELIVLRVGKSARELNEVKCCGNSVCGEWVRDELWWCE